MNIEKNALQFYPVKLRVKAGRVIDVNKPLREAYLKGCEDVLKHCNKVLDNAIEASI